jgi:hypothetical protein
MRKDLRYSVQPIQSNPELFSLGVSNLRSIFNLFSSLAPIYLRFGRYRPLGKAQSHLQGGPPTRCQNRANLHAKRSAKYFQYCISEPVNRTKGLGSRKNESIQQGHQSHTSNSLSFRAIIANLRDRNMSPAVIDTAFVLEMHFKYVASNNY